MRVLLSVGKFSLQFNLLICKIVVRNWIRQLNLKWMLVDHEVAATPSARSHYSGWSNEMRMEDEKIRVSGRSRKMTKIGRRAKALHCGI